MSRDGFPLINQCPSAPSLRQVSAVALRSSFNLGKYGIYNEYAHTLYFRNKTVEKEQNFGVLSKNINSDPPLHLMGTQFALDVAFHVASPVSVMECAVLTRKSVG